MEAVMGNDKVKLGLLGLSPGNGHPYSWAALFNGYNIDAMSNCGFSAIPEYLKNHSFPCESIKNAEVTHIWTQNQILSEHIALSSNIKHVVNHFSEMIGEIDGVLLARDDAENHLYHAKLFLENGIPIYIDKPLALSLDKGQELLEMQTYAGQIFSCSALRYAKELSLTPSQYSSLGRIKYVFGSTPKDWDKYSIHVIEPMLKLFPELSLQPSRQSRWSSAGRSVLHGECESGLEYQISAMGECCIPISLRIIGENDCIDLTFVDSFSAFKSALEIFINTTCRREVALSADIMLASISFVESGRS
jgi:hypothetical protein